MSVFGSRAEQGFGVACLLMLAVAIGLGTWQMQRLGWKRDLIARIDARVTAPATTLPPAGPFDPSLDFRRIEVRGHYVAGVRSLIGPRSHGGDSGYHLLGVVQLADGRHLLVNRGWVPADWSGDAEPADAGAEATLTGVLRTGFQRGYWTPDFDPARNLWFWYDIQGIAAHADIDLLPAVLELAAVPGRAGPPIAGVTHVYLPNNHRQYALTWFALAGVVVVMYAVYRYRRGQQP